MECPNCSAPLPTPKAKFCPRCGVVVPMARPAASASPQETPPESKPIHLEKRGNLINLFFLASVLTVVFGALLAAEGISRIGIAVLMIGVPLLIIATVRSAGR